MASDELKEGIKFCDPACGVGKFLLEFIKDKLDELFLIEKDKIVPKVEITGFDRGFDKDEQKTIILAKANMLIYFCELIKNNSELTKEFAKLFNKSFILKSKSRLGTLSDISHENEYDLILTNPPYVTSGSGSLKKEIKKNKNLKNYYKTNAKGLEGLFMEWIVKSLKPTGRAFIVVPDGILNRLDDDKLRQFILDNCYVDALISLPENTFFRNSKKTYILVITKKKDVSKNQTDPVFTYLVSEIGESRNINRFDIDQDDLNEAVELFQSFRGNKKNLFPSSRDKTRQKMQIMRN
jgi:type I restriction enzyme M protein